MSKKGKKSSEDKKSKAKDESPKETKEKKMKKPAINKSELVWNPDDGVTWHDFVGLFITLLSFIWRLAKIVFAPVFWIYAENVRMWRFVRAKGEERVMTQYEREFVEQIPVIYSLTGLIGGILVGGFVALNFKDAIEAFIESLSIDFLRDFFGFIGKILGWIWEAIKWIVGGIADGIRAIAAFVNEDPFVAFTVLVVIGIVLILVWMVLSEKGVIKKITDFLGKTFGWIIESPDLFVFNVQTWYRKFNHKVTAALIGKERMATRTLSYFQKSLFYTLITSIWAFSSGIYVGVTNNVQYTTPWEKILFISFVLLMSGIVSGFLFLMFVSRFLDMLNRKKYISPEYILEDEKIDEDHLKTDTKKVYDAKPWLREYVPKVKEEAVDEEKPWKKAVDESEEEEEEA
ncbi:MAG: hypothetical protein INQ03_08440 [Candidatus Heimdallarchaeota archaeon]|nr:hypothetical protein [Candidatus Heimdallarchaeota archaeon]